MCLETKFPAKKSKCLRRTFSDFYLRQLHFHLQYVSGDLQSVSRDKLPVFITYIYAYNKSGDLQYTAVPVCEIGGLSQTRFFRKPDVCPVSEAKFRKPVLAGLRSNNEMKIFGFRR